MTFTKEFKKGDIVVYAYADICKRASKRIYIITDIEHENKVRIFDICSQEFGTDGFYGDGWYRVKKDFSLTAYKQDIYLYSEVIEYLSLKNKE